ncbi:MAG: PAS domain S-box protein [Clostridia bacterium]|nr:PAS domain S-box protein [Clostridia bacterium]
MRNGRRSLERSVEAWNERAIQWIAFLAPVVFVGFLLELFTDLRQTTGAWAARALVLLLLLAGSALFTSYVFGTLRRQSERLRADEERLRTFVDGSSDAILIVDAGHRVVEMNPAARTLTGWEPGEGGERLLCSAVLGCRAPEGGTPCNIDCPIQSTLELGRRVPYREVVIRSRDGRDVPVSLSASEVHQGAERYAALVLRDMSERKRLENQVRSLLAQAERQRDRFEALYRLAGELAVVAGLDGKLAGVTEQLRQLSHADLAAFLTEEAGPGGPSRLLWRAVAGFRQAPPVPFEAADLPARARLARVPLAAADLSSLAERPEEAFPLLWREGARAVLAMPMLSRERVIGILLVARRSPRPFDEEEQAFVGGFASQAAIAWENSRLYQQVQNMAVVEERERIAREMHDGLAQTLGYLNLQFKLLEDEAIRAGAVDLSRRLAELRRVVKETYGDVRHSIFDLKTSAAREKRFSAILAEYLEDYRSMNGIETSAEGELALLDGLPDGAQVQAWRIVQEALANVRKHAHASRVHLAVEQGRGHLWLRISDDGVGFDVARQNAKGHYGMSIMQERAESLGGFVDILSAPGQGTQVVLAIPVPRPIEEDTRGAPHLAG